MKLWEINNLMTADKLFKISDTESADIETGEVFQQEYLDQLPMELEEKSKNIGLVIKDIENDKAQIEAEIRRLQDMKKSCERKINSLKSYVMTYGCPVKDIAVTIRFNKGRESVEIEKGIDLPERFRKYTWEANKTEIKKALDEGETIEGCKIIRKPSVTVK